MTLPFVSERRRLFTSDCRLFETFVDVGACVHRGTRTDTRVPIADACLNFLSFFSAFLLEWMTSEMTENADSYVFSKEI